MGEELTWAQVGGSFSGGSSSRDPATTSAASGLSFLPEEGLELLHDFGVGSTGVEAVTAGQKLLMGIKKKWDLAAGAATSPSPLHKPVSLQLPGSCTRASLRLLPSTSAATPLGMEAVLMTAVAAGGAAGQLG